MPDEGFPSRCFSWFRPRLRRILDNKWAKLLPAISASYFLLIKGKPDFLEKHLGDAAKTWIWWVAFAVLVLPNILEILFRKWLDDDLKKSLEDNVGSFISYVQRTASTWCCLTRNGDHCGYSHLELFLVDLESLVSNLFSIDCENINISVFRDKRGSSPPKFLVQTQKWEHTGAEELLQKKTAMRTCLNKMEDVFFNDKQRAVKSGNYHMSDRDKEHGHGVGSVYCYPVKIKTGNKHVKYVITITTYGKTLCRSLDPESIDATKKELKRALLHVERELLHVELGQLRPKRNANSRKRGTR